MSTETSTPDVPVEQRTDAAPPAAPTATDSAVDTAIDPPGVDDEFPFECSEFGVGGFLPHLDAAEGGDAGS